MIPESSPVLVTGASGFLGGHLADFLKRRGYAVRALVRATSDTRKLEALGVELCRGDLTDQPSLVAAMKGVRTVFNSAAKVSDWGPKEAFLTVNRDGAANVVAACQEAGVERVVHFSSLTVLGLPRAGETISEDSPYATGPLDKYTQSKLEGERVVREAHGRRGLSTVVVRPGAIWGPGDPHILPRIVALLRRGRMVYIGGGKNHVALSHVENLSLGLALAAEVPAAAGRVYHVIDEEDLTSREVLDGLADGLGTPRPVASVPFWLVYGAAGAMELGARLLGSEKAPPMSRYGVRLVASDCRYERSRAKKELGYQAIVSFKQGVAGLGAI
ncbi:MAG TPA: NAD-dependent epimerase/dehydratase family protein [Myxococcales bacterium]